MTEKGGVQSVERIFQLIEQLASHPAGASLQRLAQETGPCQKHRAPGCWQAWSAWAMPPQEPETGRYRLTLKMFERPAVSSTAWRSWTWPRRIWSG